MMPSECCTVQRLVVDFRLKCVANYRMQIILECTAVQSAPFKLQLHAELSREVTDSKSYVFHLKCCFLLRGPPEIYSSANLCSSPPVLHTSVNHDSTITIRSHTPGHDGLISIVFMITWRCYMTLMMMMMMIYWLRKCCSVAADAVGTFHFWHNIVMHWIPGILNGMQRARYLTKELQISVLVVRIKCEPEYYLQWHWYLEEIVIKRK